MRRNIILINESQYDMLKKHINESQVFTKMVKVIITELLKNYEPIVVNELDGMDYKSKLKVKKKVDGEEISLKALLGYLGTKYSGVSKEFLRQVITDWINGDIGEDFSLTKNVSLY